MICYGHMPSESLCVNGNMVYPIFIQGRLNKVLSRLFSASKGTLQSSVISPKLFSIMVNLFSVLTRPDLAHFSDNFSLCFYLEDILLAAAAMFCDGIIVGVSPYQKPRLWP